MDELSFEVQSLNTIEQTRTIVKVMAYWSPNHVFRGHMDFCSGFFFRTNNK